MKRTQFKLAVLLLLIAVLGGLILNRQAVHDWFRLYGYQPPQAVVQLANDTTMTSAARHLFYVNRPDITIGSDFTKHCPGSSEKTVVLGCYVGADAGIYLYQVTDVRLQGVEQVTAAHETLHAAYRRLSPSERKKVDTMLTNYYEHDLHDQRILNTIAAYKQSEPNDVVNEMHSVFGTEIAILPAPLEQYYKQYFTNRAKITAYTASYEGEFTSRQAQITRYDAELKSLKATIESDQASLAAQKSALDAQNQQLQSERGSTNVSTYNQAVAQYNAAVGVYNTLRLKTKNEITQYNDLVSERNAVVLEEQQLTKAISAP